MKLTGKRILLTGGTAGIGREMVRALADRNTLIVLGRSPAKLAELTDAHPTVRPVYCDLADLDAVDTVARQLAGDAEPIDVIICNAAIQHAARITDADFDFGRIATEVTTNFTSVAQLVARLGPHLRAGADPAMITLINSGLAIAPKTGSAVYCATKAALASFGRSLDYQLASRRVLVTQAYLPLVDTALSAGRGRNKLSAATAARQIIAGMEAEIRDHHIGQVRWLWRVFRISPGLARRIMRAK
jgi:uncharacterized oxidoreductase